METKKRNKTKIKICGCVAILTSTSACILSKKSTHPYTHIQRNKYSTIMLINGSHLSLEYFHSPAVSKIHTDTHPNKHAFNRCFVAPATRYLCMRSFDKQITNEQYFTTFTNIMSMKTSNERQTMGPYHNIHKCVHFFIVCSMASDSINTYKFHKVK